MRQYQRFLSVLADSLLRWRIVLEVMAWFMLVITAVLVLASSRGVLLMLTGRSTIDQVVRGHIVPQSIMDASNSVALSCLKLSIDHKGEAGFLKPRAAYDPIYDSYVDKTAVSTFKVSGKATTYPLTASDASLMSCVASGLQDRLGLSDPNAIVPQVLWVKTLLVTPKGKYVFVWPALPSVKAQRLRSGILDIEIPERGGLVNDSVLRGQREDEFTGEKVVDVRSMQSGGAADSTKVSTIVSLRVSSLPGTFKLAIFLNFCAILIFCCINLLVVRRLPAEEFVAWYRAWLCWAILYALYSIVYLVRLSFVDLSHWRGFFLGVIPVFSIANDSFFVIVGLYMLQWKTRRLRYRVALISGSVTAAAFVVGLISEWFYSNYRVVESLYSVGVSILLGMAFTRVLKKRRATIAGLELVGSRLAGALVGGFFFFLALHQLLIAIWKGRPGLEEIFWLLSPVTKMCLMALFFLAVLTERYWGEGEVGLEVFNRLEQGVFAIDGRGKIVNVNDSAIRMLGLPKTDMIGKGIREILFRSLFESEKLFQDLESRRGLKARKMLTKDYRGRDIKGFRAVHRLVSAQVVGETGRDRIYALFYLDGGGDAGPESLRRPTD